jgi:hypothetical protein
MKTYNKLENNLSNLIKFSPYLHSKVKYLYQSLSFLFNKEKGFRIYLDKRCKLIDFGIKNIFFGYYDHMPFSNDMKYFLSHELSTDLRLNLYDFYASKIKIKKNLVRTDHFNLQQGTRPIWISSRKIIFNNVINEKLIATIYDIENDSITNYAFPVQEISTKNNIIISIDYSKLDKINKDYSYNMTGKISQKKVDGILGYDYIDNKVVFNLSLNDIHLSSNNKTLSLLDCEINHINHSPYNNTFAFIYRSKVFNGFSELFIYNYNIDKLTSLYSGSLISHYCWINENMIFAYLNQSNQSGFYEINFLNNINFSQKLLPGNQESIPDGHPSLSPNSKWLVYDTYPDKKRQSHLYIINNKLLKKPEKILIGKFFSPLKFYGYNRCDLHPRWSPDGKFISIDSTHEGIRKSYLINVSKIIDEYEKK